jgi:hypothetical protein
MNVQSRFQRSGAWPQFHAPAAFQVLAVLGILACGVDAALIRFVHLSLAPLLDDFFDAASEPACAAILSIVAFCSLSESENENT